MVHTGPWVHCVPSSDRAFIAHVERLIASTRLDGPHSPVDIDLFETRLRAGYPAAVVRARRPTASLGMPGTLWYVVRDGRLDGHAPARLAIVVESEPLVGELVAQLLVRRGWRAIVTPNARAALAETSGLPADLLVIDWEAPDEFAPALVAQARAGNGSTPVIVVSAGPDHAGLAALAGLHVLPKPFDTTDLIARIEGLTVSSAQAS